LRTLVDVAVAPSGILQRVTPGRGAKIDSMLSDAFATRIAVGNEARDRPELGGFLMSA